MIFQLFLLVSPAFGMPSNALLDVGNQIIDQLDSLPLMTEEGKNILKNSKLTETIAEALSEAEKKAVRGLLIVLTLSRISHHGESPEFPIMMVSPVGDLRVTKLLSTYQKP